MLTTFVWIDLFIVFGAALAMLIAAGYLDWRRRKSITVTQLKPVSGPDETPVLTFEFDPTGALTCSNAPANEFLASLSLFNPDWPILRSTLLTRFADLPSEVEPQDIAKTTQIAPLSKADPMTLEIERHTDGLTLVLKERKLTQSKDRAAVHDVLSALPNLDLVHAASENAPFPVWQTTKDGQVGWSNLFYQQLKDRIDHGADHLFEIAPTQGATKQPLRVPLKDGENNKTHWFDITRQNFDDGYLNFAIDVHAVVNAETAQRNFVQTLAKTFAHLATGLAIFDRNRQLVLFNPSLFDITELKPEFLTARPNLFTFFDQLRNNQIMPEPKNYADWRERIANVISAASEDNFSETWHLHNGLTYRVTGRPHPDGAIAFLFEDISAEISLTRRFRNEADVTRSALDSLDDAIAIFNSAGFLQQCNSSMQNFVGKSTEQDLENMSVRDVTRLCQSACLPSPVWGEIRDFVVEGSERATWSANLMRKDGQNLFLKASPLASGASLVTLAPSEIRETVAKEKTRPTSETRQTQSAVA